MVKKDGGLGAIKADEVYPLPVFAERAGLGRVALRSARSAGLKTVRQGNRVYVRGSDFLAFLAKDSD